MSDFIEQLMNRHLGIGEQVTPRARSRFEPEPAPAVLETSPVDDPVEETIGMADLHPPKQSVQFSNPPVIEPEPGDAVIPNQSSLPDVSPESPGTGKNNKDSTRIPDADKQPVISRNRLEYNVEKPSGDNVQKAAGPLLSPVSKVEPITPGKPGHPIHIIINKTQETFNDQQSARQSPSAPEAVPEAAPEPFTLESQPVITPWQNTGTKPGGLLEVPAQLLERQSEDHKQFFLKESETRTEPVVNVTIGRIEVRATRPSEPEQPRRKKKPSGIMSLDQYLGRRVQGGNP